jgi:hypothetical protein
MARLVEVSVYRAEAAWVCSAAPWDQVGNGVGAADAKRL